MNDLLAALPEKRVIGTLPASVSSIAGDSRRVEPGAVARLTLTPAAGGGSPCEPRRVERRGEGARGEASCDRGER